MKGIFPGSFDPPTRGHLDLIRRAASMMDHVTICVMVNISKAGTIPTEERVRMLEKACRDIPNVGGLHAQAGARNRCDPGCSQLCRV